MVIIQVVVVNICSTGGGGGVGGSSDGAAGATPANLYSQNALLTFIRQGPAICLAPPSSESDGYYGRTRIFIEAPARLG